MATISSVHSSLRTVFDVPSRNATVCQSEFKKFQLFLIRKHTSLKGIDDLKLAMYGLEMGALITVEAANWSGFERVMQQLRPYYTQAPFRKASKQRPYLEGLYLLYLLTESKLVEFHTELELMRPAEDFVNEWIRISLDIDEAMIEGNYQTIDRVLAVCKDTHYSALLSRLQDAIRGEIAKSLEAAHVEIPIDDAIVILRFSALPELKQFIADKSKSWEIADGTLRFAPIVEQKSELKALDTISDMLKFTKEIETIV